MSQPISRTELYNLVWSTPVRTVASTYGVSDVAFAKMCHRHGIPIPPRGYWARIEAGQKPPIDPLPRREFGMPEIIRLGTSYWDRHSVPKNLDEIEINPPPIFSEGEEELRERARKMVGAVAIPRNLDRPHHQIARLLRDDAERLKAMQGKKYLSFFDRPIFEPPFEKRRLRLLSGIFSALHLQGMSVVSRKKDPDTFDVTVGEQFLSIGADHPGAERMGWRHDRDRERPASAKMVVQVYDRLQPNKPLKTWTDKESDPVEGHATDIVVSTMVLGEMIYREHEEYHYKMLVERKAEMIVEKQRRKEEAIRAAEEARIKAEKNRIDRLLSEASAFRRAQDIRQYVAAARGTKEQFRDLVSDAEFEAWAAWASENADRIDPVLSKAFLRNIGED